MSGAFLPTFRNFVGDQTGASSFIYKTRTPRSFSILSERRKELLRFKRGDFSHNLYYNNQKLHSPISRAVSFEDTVGSKTDETGERNLDTILKITDSFCLVSSSLSLVGLVTKWVIPRWKRDLPCLPVDGLVLWLLTGLVASLIIGTIRRCTFRCVHSGTGVPQVNLVDRVDKLDDAIRNSTTVVRLLSRQLEKIGIRFRVTRKSLRRPIDEVTAMAKNNSESVRSLALKEAAMEEELGEIQKVLLAMQEQQKKQLELILTIGKSIRSNAKNK